MKLKQKWNYGPSAVKEMSVGDLVIVEVHGTSTDRGVLEDCDAKINRIAQLIGALADLLPETAQVKFVEAIGGWEVL
jgi:hypothetical protein